MIDDSLILQEFIFDMPKGGILHAHLESVVDLHWVIANATYREYCYINTCESSSLHGALRMYPMQPSDSCWQTVISQRKASGNATAYDEALYQSILLGDGFHNGLEAWSRFNRIFALIEGVTSFLDFRLAYMRELFDRLMLDNVQYIEIRDVFQGAVYDFERNYTDYQVLHDYIIPIVQEYQQAYPNKFSGVRWIACGLRFQDTTDVWNNMMSSLKLRSLLPEWIVGYDLVGEEPTGHTTVYFLQDFIKFQQQQTALNVSMPFYFHAGESDWYSNENLYDVLLLETKRIGHGYAIAQHPLLQDIVKERQTALEVCPISNMQLMLLEDMRNHPGAQFVRNGVPFVLAYDDPSVYGYDRVSYDFWEAFMSWDMDLRSLKQVSVNSLKFSAMNDDDKAIAFRVFQDNWDAFIAAKVQLIHTTGSLFTQTST
jgi:adenosine deaminase CECR1